MRKIIANFMRNIYITVPLATLNPYNHVACDKILFSQNH